MKTQIINNNIELGYKLTTYLLAHPEILDVYPTKNIIMFSKRDKKLNQINTRLLLAKIEARKRVIAAILLNKTKNIWKFELATKKNLPKITKFL